MFFKKLNWSFQQPFEKEFSETSQSFNSFSQLLFLFFSISCLIELKFCEVSWNSFSKRCWKFQFSVLKIKKVLFLKKVFFKSISKQKTLFIDPIFSEGLGVSCRYSHYGKIFSKIFDWLTTRFHHFFCISFFVIFYGVFRWIFFVK